MLDVTGKDCCPQLTKRLSIKTRIQNCDGRRRRRRRRRPNTLSLG